MPANTSPKAMRRRLRHLSQEPGVRDARDAYDRATQARQQCHRELRDFSDRIAEAETAAADALLAGKKPPEGADLEVLRLARQRKRGELQVLDRAMSLAHDRYQAALEAAKAELAREYVATHRALLEEVEAAVDAAMRINTELRDLEYAATEALGNQVPHDLALSWLVPATEDADTRYAAWKDYLKNWRRGQR